MRPVETPFFATDDDEIEPEPLTVPRPRTISGISFTGVGGADQREAPSEPRWTVTDETSSPSSAGSEEEAGIYPIFDDGGAALDWIRRRRAVAKVSAAIEEDPDNPKLYLERAAAKVELGAPREAIDDCTRALAIRPDFVDAYLARAQIHFDVAAYVDCAADCTKALRMDRTRVEAYQRRANARAAIGDYAAAIGDYDEAIMLRPRLAALFKERGEMKSRIGDLAGALDDLNVAVAMSPADEDGLFKRNLVKVMISDHCHGPVDWARATQKALELLSAKVVAKVEEEEDDRIA